MCVLTLMTLKDEEEAVTAMEMAVEVLCKGLVEPIVSARGGAMKDGNNGKGKPSRAW